MLTYTILSLIVFGYFLIKWLYNNQIPLVFRCNIRYLSNKVRFHGYVGLIMIGYRIFLDLFDLS